MSTQQEETLRKIRVLDPPAERKELALSAIVLVAEGFAEGVAALASHLARTAFLARLDALDQPQFKTLNLALVFEALERHPSDATRDLCISVANSSEFTSDPIRMNLLLPALAAVRPMTKGAAEVFRRANGEGYYPVNAPLLVRNGSPVALRLFEEMIQDRSVDPENRVDALRWSLLPYRTEYAVMAMCRRLLDGGLEPEVELGVIETLFDWQVKLWFGPVRVAPRPRPWHTASDEAVRMALQVADEAAQRPDLPDVTRAAVERSVAELDQLVSQRRQ
jgi:hypothetical protein